MRKGLAPHSPVCALVVLLLCVVVHGQTNEHPASANASADKSALLAFKGNTSAAQTYLGTWSNETDPCPPGGWDELTPGYYKVRCDAEYGRVVVISLKRHSYRSDYYPAEPFAHNIAALATLTELRHLNLELLNDGAYGDIAWLSGLTELRLIQVERSSVHGNVNTLSSLPHLGKDDYGDGSGGVGGGGLSVPDTVFGPMPGHPESLLNPRNATAGYPYRWIGTGSGRVGGLEYTSCSYFGIGNDHRFTSCAERGLAQAPHANFLSGTDECTCCMDSPQHIDEATQRCSNSAVLEWAFGRIENCSGARTSPIRKCDSCCDSCDACEQCATCAVCNGAGVATAHARGGSQCEHMAQQDLESDSQTAIATGFTESDSQSEGTTNTSSGIGSETESDSQSEGPTNTSSGTDLETESDSQSEGTTNTSSGIGSETESDSQSEGPTDTSSGTDSETESDSQSEGTTNTSSGTEEVTVARSALSEAMAAAFTENDTGTDAVPTAPVVEISAQVSFPIAITAIPEGSPERNAFVADFKTQMAANVGGISADKVIVDGITASRRRRRAMAADSRRVLQGDGVNVDFHIVVPVAVQTEAVQLVASVDTSAVAITVGDQVVSASAISDPVVTAVLVVPEPEPEPEDEAEVTPASAKDTASGSTASAVVATVAAVALAMQL